MNKVVSSITLIKEFKEHEFKCQCGHSDCDYGFADMEEDFIYKLFTARKMSFCGFTITSAVRCPRHPLAITKPTSSHNANRAFRKKSKAVDIAAVTSGLVFEVTDALRKAGFTRLGWNQTSMFIHVDSDATKPQRLFFSY
jgi:zinc D-Ala-D-Ala carboxypeptidase